MHMIFPFVVVSKVAIESGIYMLINVNKYIIKLYIYIYIYIYIIYNISNFYGQIKSTQERKY